jgi:hypothetical protein
MAARTLAIAIVALTAAPVHAEPKYEELVTSGAIALEAHRLGDAERFFTAALDRSSRPGWMHFNLCLTHYLDGAYGRALQACYRSLEDPGTEGRAYAIMHLISQRIASAALDGLLLPEPTHEWFDPDRKLSLRISGGVPRDESGPVRHVQAAKAAASAFALDAAVVERMRGPAPPNPYVVRPHDADATRGFALVPKLGTLFYAPDTTPFVAGARAEYQYRVPGKGNYRTAFVEYMHALDGNGGIGSVGGGFGGLLGFEYSASVPWGRDARRVDVTYPGYLTGVYFDARISARFELPLGKSSIAGEIAVLGGVNPGKLMKMLGQSLKDFCLEEEGDPACMTEDKKIDPEWKTGFVMLELGIALGRSFGYPRYARADLYAPVGSP